MRVLCFLFFTVVCVTSPVLAQEHSDFDAQNNCKADAARHYTLHYNMYAGGLHGVSAQIRLCFDDKHYTIQTTTETRGLIGLIYPMMATHLSKGWIDENDQLHPSHYEAVAKARSKIRKKQLVYDKNGLTIAKINIKNGKKRRAETGHLDKAKGAVDFQTVFAIIIHRLKKDMGLSQTVGVFDGKRRYDVKLTKQNPEELEKNRYSMFAGKAILTHMDVLPYDGTPENNWFWHRNDESENKQMPVKIWFSDFLDDMPPIPVRFEIDSHGFGSIVAHLAEVTQDGEGTSGSSE